MPDTKMVEVDLMDAIRHSATVFDHYSNVSIDIFPPEGVEQVRIKGDRDQLLRSFNNLIKNAIEASMVKRRCKIEIRVTVDEEELTVQVIDNGEGIHPKAQR